VRSFAALFEQSSDLVIESLYTLSIGERGLLDVAHMFGTLVASGGDFETVYARLFVFEGERPVGLELFELEHLEIARARFEELADPSAIAPNDAARASVQMAMPFLARDWAAVRALAGPGFVFDDRRRQALVTGDIEVWIRNLQVVREWPGRRTARDLVAVLGDRIAIERIRYAGESDEAAYEGEFFQVVEIDAGGLLRAVLHFDAQDRDAAFAEAQRRFPAGEAD